MKLEAKLERREDGQIALRSPEVGLWRDLPRSGALIAPGVQLGRIERLGVLVPIFAPQGAAGIVVERGGDEARARRPVGYGDRLLLLDPEAAAGAGVVAEAAATRDSDADMVFTAPSSGRFYRRPAPDKPPFVEVGDAIARGDVVAVLEVMKTFNRIHFEGAGLPERAKVLRVGPDDGDDLDAGDVILELESVD